MATKKITKADQLKKHKEGRTERAIKQDKDLKAKKSGKRKTAWGTTYTENRPNRSDVGKKQKRQRI